jgi:DNA polymerase III alpha subunit
MAALLTSFRDDKDKASVYLNEARQMGITVGVPDVNESFAEYAPSLSQDQTILFGLAAVRNVGEALVEKIVSEREANGPSRRSTTSCAGSTRWCSIAAPWSRSSRPAPSTRSACRAWASC